MNMEKELIIRKAQEGYTVCYVENCPLRNRCPLRHHPSDQPHLLLRVSQRLASHSACVTGKHPQPVPRKRMDHRRAVRRLCRGLRLVARSFSLTQIGH